MKCYYPGCKVKAAYPRESELLKDYIVEKTGAEVMGCCRANWDGHAADDEAIMICNNCHEILTESSGFGSFTSVWKIIDEDADFAFPDYGGAEMALQDCWIATGNHEVQDTVRSLMGKMNLRVVELPENRDDCRACGSNILVDSSASNAKLAPRRWGTLKDEQIEQVPEEEWPELFAGRAAAIPGDDVACYCKFCADGLREGGKNPRHLIQLLFSE